MGSISGSTDAQMIVQKTLDTFGRGIACDYYCISECSTPFGHKATHNLQML